MIKNVIGVLCLIFLLVIWSVPIIVAVCTGNFWYIMLYMVWWIPAMLFTAIIGAILGELS